MPHAVASMIERVRARVVVKGGRCACGDWTVLRDGQCVQCRGDRRPDPEPREPVPLSNLMERVSFVPYRWNPRD
jgi:hypothetical protein